MKTKTIDTISFAATLAASLWVNNESEHKAVLFALRALVEDEDMWEDIVAEAKQMGFKTRNL